MIIHDYLDKPECKMIGEDGNIFNLMALARRALTRAACDPEEKTMRRQQADEMIERITSSGSYDEALCILGEYVDIY